MPFDALQQGSLPVNSRVTASPSSAAPSTRQTKRLLAPATPTAKGRGWVACGCQAPAAQAEPETGPSAVPLAVDFGFRKNLLDEYSVSEQIGAGSYGVIKKATKKNSGQVYAVKELRKAQVPRNGKLPDRQRVLERLQAEPELLGRLRGCRNVVGLEGVYEDEHTVQIVTEYCDGGDLFSIVQKNGPLPETQAAAVLYEVLKIVAACQARNVVHCDLKPNNILLRREFASRALNGNEFKGPWLVAIDLGCGQDAAPGQPPLSKVSGTPLFMAPEVLMKRYGKAADMWSVGIIMYLLIAGRYPFWPTMEASRNLPPRQVFTAVMGGAIDFSEGPWANTSSQAQDLCSRLLDRTAGRRITVLEALKHPWFRMFRTSHYRQRRETGSYRGEPTAGRQEPGAMRKTNTSSEPPAMPDAALTSRGDAASPPSPTLAPAVVRAADHCADIAAEAGGRQVGAAARQGHGSDGTAAARDGGETGGCEVELEVQMGEGDGGGEAQLRSWWREVQRTLDQASAGDVSHFDALLLGMAGSAASASWSQDDQAPGPSAGPSAGRRSGQA